LTGKVLYVNLEAVTDIKLLTGNKITELRYFGTLAQRLKY